jgi:hypothetical protein
MDLAGEDNVLIGLDDDLDDLPTLTDPCADEDERPGKSIDLMRALAIHAASIEAPEGEIIYDPDAPPIVRTRRDAELAIIGLDPDSLYPSCDWCETDERHGAKPSAHGRWWMHTECFEEADRDGLASIHLPPRDWDWDTLSPTPACSMRQRPRPPALTDEQIAQIVALRRWHLSQVQIAERLGVDQATVSRALRRAEERGIRPAKVRGEQLAIDWFGEGEAA